MKFNQLKIKPNKNRKRKGRGIAAGQGKTAGRGTKGQNARSGGRVRPFFEGGQMPLVRKLPKLGGFKSRRPKVAVIYTGQLNNLPKSQIIDNQFLAKNKLIKNAYQKVKLIKKGSLDKAYRVQIQGASKSAQNDLKAAGGSFKKVARLKQAKTVSKQPRKLKKKFNKQRK